MQEADREILRAEEIELHEKFINFLELSNRDTAKHCRSCMKSCLIQGSLAILQGAMLAWHVSYTLLAETAFQMFWSQLSILLSLSAGVFGVWCLTSSINNYHVLTDLLKEGERILREAQEIYDSLCLQLQETQEKVE